MRVNASGRTHFYKRATLLSGLFTSLLVALTACVLPSNRSAVSIKVSPDGDLWIAVCGDFEVSRLYVSERTPKGTSELWNATGESFLTYGTILDFAEEVPGLMNDISQLPDPHVGTKIYVELDLADEEGFVGGHFPSFTHDALDSGKWLHTDGILGDVPCDLPTTSADGQPSVEGTSR